jgi:hypothetical protein
LTPPTSRKSASMVEEIEVRSRILRSHPALSRLQVVARFIGVAGLLAAAAFVAYWLVESSINFAGSPDAPPDALTRRAMP